MQWVEHGRPIDRFEGVYRRGKREGFGRYDWPTGDRFEGTYADDLPNGRGSVTIDGCRIKKGASWYVFPNGTANHNSVAAAWSGCRDWDTDAALSLGDASG